MNIRLPICVVVLLIVGCDGRTVVRGVVQDSDGNPIVDTSVSLDQQPIEDPSHRHLTEQSDDQGRFSVGFTHAPSKGVTFTLSVSKDGFLPYSETVTFDNRDRARVIILKRAPMD